MEDERSESSDSNMLSDDSDLEDSSNSNSGDSSSNFFDFDESDFVLDSMDTTNDNEQEAATGSSQSGILKNQENQYWTRITPGQLQDSTQAEKPSTSKKVSKQPNVPPLDDSTVPCSICLSDMREEDQENDDVVVQLTMCTHMFHEGCIRSAFKVKKQCPLCMCWYGSPIGYQPLDATMNVRRSPGIVPGHTDAQGFHEITYHIPGGIQSEGHIRPGEPYRSSTRVAYLPNNAEGTEVLKLLQLAFKRRLIFTIGDSVTTGRKNVPVWNGIHHKTMKDGGPQSYGYPDPSYLSRVKEELASVGVFADQLDNN